MSEDKQVKSPKILVDVVGKEGIEDFFHKIEQTKNKKFEEYLIAYIDFLGIKEKMKQESSFGSLQILKFILSNARKKAAYITNINTIDDFDIKVFSDNVVIAQKVSKERLSDQIISIVNVVSLLQFEAYFQFDFPLRGGITIGELFIDNSIVWGTGLISAYKMESNYANYPRVLISQELLNTYDRCEKKSINLYPLLKKDFDGVWFVNFFLAVPNLKLIPEISRSLREQSLLHENEDNRARQKINWIIFRFNQMCIEFKDRGDYEQYILPFI